MGRREENNNASAIVSFSWHVLLLAIAINLNHWMRNCSVMVKNSYLMPSYSWNRSSMETEGHISKFKVYPRCLPLTQPLGWKSCTCTKTNNGVRTTTTKYMYIQISLTDLKEQKHGITSNHSPCFLKLPKSNGANHFTLQTEFLVLSCKW